MSGLDQAKANRERMPQTAAIVDAFRAAFGPDVHVLWAREGDAELGERSAVVRSMDADQWLAFMASGKFPEACDA
jgi:hypothetical protein